MTVKKLPLAHAFTEDLQSPERSLMKIRNSHCCGFVAIAVVGNVLGIVMVVTIVHIRDLDNVVFPAIICNLPTAMALVIALVVTDGSKVVNQSPSSAGSLGQ